MESWREELYSDELYHHGIKGQRWGVRRFQNEDGSLTERGKKRYGYVTNSLGETEAYRVNNKRNAKQLTRQANDFSRQLANDEAERRYNTSKIVETTQKLNAYESNQSTKKAEKARKELALLTTDNIKLNSLIERNKNGINKALNQAKLLGMDVSSKKTLEYSERGKQLVKAGQYVGGLMGNILMTNKITDDDRYHSYREHYKIKSTS